MSWFKASESSVARSRAQLRVDAHLAMFYSRACFTDPRSSPAACQRTGRSSGRCEVTIPIDDVTTIHPTVTSGGDGQGSLFHQQLRRHPALRTPETGRGDPASHVPTPRLGHLGISLAAKRGQESRSVSGESCETQSTIHSAFTAGMLLTLASKGCLPQLQSASGIPTMVAERILLRPDMPTLFWARLPP